MPPTTFTTTTSHATASYGVWWPLPGRACSRKPVWTLRVNIVATYFWPTSLQSLPSIRRLSFRWGSAENTKLIYTKQKLGCRDTLVQHQKVRKLNWIPGIYICFSKVLYISISIGLPQPAQSPYNGSQGHCTAGHGHLDSSCACPHGGRAPDVNPLDSENHCGGGTHCTTIGAHTSSHCATLQGKEKQKKTLMGLNGQWWNFQK